MKLLQVGDAAPPMTLPAVNREGSVSLPDYRGRTPVLLGLFRGLHCPYCRRHLVVFSGVAQKLADRVATVGVVNTPLDRARLYLRNAANAAVVLADPDAASHRAFVVPQVAVAPIAAGGRSDWPWQETVERLATVEIGAPPGIGEQVPLFEANDRFNQRDGFELLEGDRASQQAHGTQLVGYFGIARDGIIRWRFVEGERRPEDIGKFPTEAELLAAGRSLAGA